MESPRSHFLNTVRLAARGFTILEMTVSLAIISIIMSVVVISQSNFNKSLVLTDTAYTIALAIRQMQSYGLSSRYFSSGSSSYNNAGFGIHFSSGSPRDYWEYGDISSTASEPVWCPIVHSGAFSPSNKPGNCIYDGSTEDVQKFTLMGGYTITNLCGRSGGLLVCSDSSQNSSVDIEYIRPNMQTVMTGNFGGIYSQLSTACVQLSSPGNATSTWVTISQLGQITVSNGSC